MANRYDIIHIDFQANARGANAAIESIRKEAEESSKKIEQLKKDLDAAIKGGDTYTADLIKGNLRGEEKRLRQLTQAQNELIKGMRVLDQAVKQFNDGSLQEMNAAFQKSAYNAAKLAQSKMQTGTKEWREMGAIMQETEQNYTRMQRDTDQLIEHLKNGGTVFRKTLEDEKKGLQDLLQVLPYMGVEYRKAEEQLKFLTKTTDDMLIKERQLKGEIVTTDDARRESLKLTQEGAEAARRQGEAAEKEIGWRTKVAEVLDRQRQSQEQLAKQSAQEVADNIERLQEYEDVIEGAGIAIKEAQDKIKDKQDKADRLESDADIAYRQYLDLQKKRDEATKNDTQATKENTEANKENAESIKQVGETVKQVNQQEAIKPKVDTSEIDALSAKLEEANKRLKFEEENLEGLNRRLLQATESNDKALSQIRNAQSKLQKKFVSEEIGVFGRAKAKDTITDTKEMVSAMSDLSGDDRVGFIDTMRRGIYNTLGNKSLVDNIVNELNSRADFLKKAIIPGKTPELKEELKSVKELLLMFKEVQTIQKGITEYGGGKGLVRLGGIEAEIDEQKETVRLQKENVKIIKEKIAAQQQGTTVTKSETEAIKDKEAETQKLIQLQKELDEAMAKAGYKGKDAESIDLQESLKRSAKTGYAQWMPNSQTWKHRIDQNSSMDEWVHSLANTRGFEDNFKPLAKETIKNSLSSYLGDGKSIADLKQLQEEWKKVVRGFSDQQANDKGYKEAIEYIERLINKTVQLKEVEEKRNAVKSQKSVVDGIKQETEATEKETAAEDKSTESKKKKTKATKDDTKATKENTKASKEEAEQVDEVAEAKKKWETADRKAKRARNEANKAIEEGNKTIEETNALIDDTKNKQAQLERQQEKSVATNKRNQDMLAKTTEMQQQNGEAMQQAELKKIQAQGLTVKQLETIIALYKKQHDEELEANTDAWREKGAEIERLTKILNEWKEAPTLQKMTERMQNVPNLSAAALQETKKFWEGMVAGAEKGSTELKIYEGNLKVIAEEERLRNKELKNKEYRKDAKSLFGDLSRKSTEEINTAINAGKKLLDTYKAGSPAAEKLAKAILDAEEYVKQYGVEAERTARKEETLRQTMVNRISNLKNLSDEGLVETKKYWQEQMKGAERTSAAYKEAEQNIKAINDRQKELANIQQRQTARQVLRRDLTTMSEGELRNAINAAKEYMQQFSIGGKVREKYNEAILRGEKLLKEYSAETMKAKQQEEELRQTMVGRMNHLFRLSGDGLAETKKYWEAQMKGAERTSEAYKEAERNIKAINEQQKEFVNQQLRTDARKVFGNQSAMSEGELRTAINAAKEYMQQFSIGGKVREKYNEAILRGEKLLKEYSAETMKAKQQEEALRQTMEGRMGKLSSLSAEALEETKKYWTEQMKGAERGTQAYRDFEARIKAINEEQKQLHQSQIQRTARSIFGNQEMMSEEQLRNAINAAKEYVQQFKVGGDVRRMYNDAIARGEELLKRYSVETEKATQKEREQNQLMVARLSTLNTLSTEGLSETKKYWQAQMDGADRASRAFKDAEDAMRRITEQERIRQNAQAMKVIDNMGAYSDAEINDAIKAFEQLRDAQAHGSAEWEMYNKHVQEGKKYLEEWAQVDSVIKYEGQMSNLTTLSDAALQETKKFWETMVAGAEKGSSELRQYEAQLERVTQEERERNQMANEMKAQKLGGRYADMSEQEIREAIEAGTQLIKTYDSGSEEAKVLSERIVRASEYLKQHGTEALRVAQQEAEAIRKRQENDRLMKQQLDNIGSGMSQSALKAQEQYWQRLIDDPKTAASSLDIYRQNLEKVKMLQDLMAKDAVSVAGEDVLSRLRGDVDYESKISENQRKEDVTALTAYRDALPKEGNLSLLREIDYYLKQLGVTAKESAQDTMTLTQALDLAKKAGTDGFISTPQEIQQATKAIEQQRDAIIKTIKAKRDSGQATDAEEKELQDLTNKLKALKFEQDNFNMSQAKMQELMRTPTNAVSLDELRAAIKRADAELKRMEGSLGQNNKQYQEFAAQVKNAKNQLKEMEGQAKATSTAWEKAWSRLKTYVGMYMGFNMAWQKVTGTADDLLELSDKMGEVRKTTGFTADEVGRLSDNLAKLDTRTSLTGLMEFSSLAGSIGMKTQEQVQGFTEAANMLAVSLPEMGNEASRTLMKIADATGDLEKNGGNVRETLERVGSTIIALRANSAAAAGPITDFVSRVGAVGAQAGISIDQIAALGATVDALGGRVEMSATALSRMIPAIKNNTFEVAKAIGMTEKELKDMTGMEQMVAIFRKLHDSAKGFDTSTEEGMNAMADSVEKALGRSTSMQEVMKELNQQGARAGIVFGLLSQNVDKLEEQLDTASEAYSKNVALMNEYSKMNDTAAAKWARLRNQLEEFFVSADNTSWLSDLIDTLRTFVDMLTDEGPFGRLLRWSIAYWAMLKAKWTEAIGTALISSGKFLAATQASTAATAADTAAKTANAAATEATAVANEHAAVASGKFNKTMKANVIAAVATAVVALGWAFYDYAQKAKKAAKQMDMMAEVEKKAREESVKERAELEKLYKVTQNQTASMEERKKALKDMVGDAKYQEYYSKLSTESELAAAAASAYKELSEQILATARARALDAKAEELQRRRIELEDQRKDREQWEDANRGKYRKGQQQYQQQQRYVGRAIGRGTAGFQESQIAQQGAVAMKPAIIDEFEGSVKERNRIDNEIGQIDKDLDKLKQQVSKLNIKTDGGNGGNGGGGNPYGNYDRVKSDYNDWDANALVARRKEMLERVRALANGADVQAVLSEDAKFISEAVRKNIKTTRDAIEWYNTERLKIQEALHAKHLTNTGDWMDPKQQKIRKKLMQDDMKAYLEELDAYYTERKTEIDRARNDEEISEAEAWNRNIKNEAEWHKRRAELQIMYSNKHKQIAEDEQDAISAIIAERTDDDAKYIKATIANTRKFSEAVKAMNDQGAKEYRKFQGDLDLGSEKDWNKVEKALTQHLKAIEEIVNKERPFNGIAKNMQDNLGKMGILTADLTEGADSAAEELKRITFLLAESENAYTMTVEKLLDDMRQKGFKEWADVISKDPSMQQGLLAMLRQTFDSVQDAIKKESSIIKKQVEIMMQDITEQVQADTTRLQILQNSVERANSLIGAGTASARVADKLAIKQIQMQITMQETRLRMLQKRGADAVVQLKQEADLLEKQGKIEEAKQKRMDAENIDKSVGLTLTKEQVELDKQRVSLSEKLEESQNRLYTSLREWADLLTDNLRNVFEASHAGSEDYYNERAKMQLTGKGGPGAGTYVVIDHAGTSDAEAHYEYLTEAEALERQYEIERQNAEAEAWKKLWDDVNNKINDTITDQLNAMLQNQSLDRNTDAVVDNVSALGTNTEAIGNLTNAIAAAASHSSDAAYRAGGNGQTANGGNMGVGKSGVPNALRSPDAIDSLALKFNSTDDIKRFQRENGLVDDGIVGPKTLAKLNEKGITKTGETQYELNGQRIGFDDEQAVRDFQIANGITPVTGTVGPKTMDKLDEMGATKVQDMTFDVSPENQTALEYLEKLNAFTIEPKTVDVNVSGQGTAQEEGDGTSWKPIWQMTEEERVAGEENINSLWKTYSQAGSDAMAQMNETLGTLPNAIPDPASITPESAETVGANAAAMYNAAAAAKITASERETEAIERNAERQKQAINNANDQATKGTQTSFAKMTAAANLYGIAYGVMCNDNLDASQKFQMFAVQAAGQAAISMLTTDLATQTGKNSVVLPGILGKLLGEMPYPVAMATFAGVTALLGGLMGLAVSQIAKSKSQISQATGASASVGKLATGMLSYKEGNVNEFTDPSSLTPGRSYNVDAADGHTYRAKYMGKDAKTHITNGPEFHLVGEAGREAIIDAHTTRLLQTDDTGIWKAIQTLYNGGSLRGVSHHVRRGMPAFADGNLDEFVQDEGMMSEGSTVGSGISPEMMAGFQSSLDRNSAIMEHLAQNGIKAYFSVYGKGGLVDSYDTGKKTVQRHGERY